MKERINKFFYKGYHILCCAWMDVAFLLYMIIDGIIECSWKQALFGVLTYTPWIILFFREYHFHKAKMKKVFLIKFMNGVNDNLIATIERYKNLYGELPEEEPKEGTKEEQP